VHLNCFSLSNIVWKQKKKTKVFGILQKYEIFSKSKNDKFGTPGKFPKNHRSWWFCKIEKSISQGNYVDKVWLPPFSMYMRQHFCLVDQSMQVERTTTTISVDLTEVSTSRQ
jgi:hypothetical protein